MTVFSISRRITAWVDDELDEASRLSGEEFGREVSMTAGTTPKGDAIIWLILVTLRSPFLGEPPIGSLGKIQGNFPSEPVVRHTVRSSAESVRKEFERKQSEGLPQGNGHGHDLPPGLRGLKL